MLDKFSEVYDLNFEITDKTHAGFIQLFNDENRLHTNSDFAQSKGFLGKVMHGNILNGFLSYFIGECLESDEVIIHSQSIDFKKPCYLNDKLSFQAVLKDKFESVGVLVFGFTFKNQSDILVAKGKIQIGII